MKPKGAPPGRHTAPSTIDLQEQKLVETRINQGMITSFDSSDIDPSALQLARNVTIRFDELKRRVGSVLLTPIKPNSEPVIKLAFIKKQDGLVNTFRMTPSTIHIRGENSWFPVSIPVPLTGTTRDRFTTADILDTFIFSNNGADPIQTIDFNTGICAPLGNAPRYRYVTGFFNRAVGFARRDEAEQEVGWSADGNAFEWNSTANPSAGSSPLVESPADLSDWITGGLSFTNVMIVFREKSIWLATKQPIQQDPFYFYTGVPGIGCNCPFTTQIIDEGSVAWVNQATKGIYAYTPGNVPERIDTLNTKGIFTDLTDTSVVFAAYDKLNSEYTVYIPIGGNVVRGWTYNRLTKAWAQNEYLNLSSANDTELAAAGLTIDELVGSIDDLGDVHIDDLSGHDSSPAARSYGFSTGEIAVEDETVDLDVDDEFESIIQSKTFVFPQVDVNVCKLLIEYKCTRAGAINLEYSKDDGTNWILAKTITPTIFNKTVLMQMKKVVRARRFTWRLRFSASDIMITRYELYVTPSGDSHV